MIQVKLPNGETMQKWDGPLELLDECEKIGAADYMANLSGLQWSGGIRHADLYKLLQNGNPKYVEEAERIMKEIMENVNFSSLRSEYIYDVAGAFPDIGAYLSGSPKNMRRRIRVENENAPLKMWIGISSSGGIGKSVLINRGIAFLSLALAMSRVRPVELWAFDNTDCGVFNAIRLPMSPPDLGVLTTVLVEPAFDRNVCMSYSFKAHNYRGRWNPRGYDMQACREILCAKDDDYVIGHAHLYDKAATDPIGWVKEQLAILTNKLDE